MATKNERKKNKKNIYRSISSTSIPYQCDHASIHRAEFWLEERSAQRRTLDEIETAGIDLNIILNNQFYLVNRFPFRSN